MTARAALVVLLGTSILAGCGGDAWPKTAGDTSCSEWLDKMTTGQRMGLGQAMLVALWNKDGAAQEPPEGKVTLFANAIGGACTAWRTEKVSSVGAGLYTLSSDIKP